MPEVERLISMLDSTRLHRGITRRLGKYLHPIWPGTVKDIVFVVGCPRSGTTVFGDVMSQHPDFLYLHEPRYIWCGVNPRLNVWWRADAEHAVLYWDASDVDPRERHLLARWFHLALTLSGRRRLVEKVPLNIFRMRWLSAMFPDARFIHLVRHGRDVALSIQKAVERWFSPELGYTEGYWESHWNYLMFEDYAQRVPELSDKLDIVRSQANNYARSLFVWLCSVWEGCQAGREIGSEKCLSVCYEELIHDPAIELQRVFEFLKEPVDEDAIAYARTVLHANSVRKPDLYPEVTAAIAGSMLAELGYEV